MALLDLFGITTAWMIALVTQMVVVKTVPMEVTQVGPGQAIVTQGDFEVVTWTPDGALTLNGNVASLEQIVAAVEGDAVVFRTPHCDMLQVMSALMQSAASLKAQVDDSDQGGN